MLKSIAQILMVSAAISLASIASAGTPAPDGASLYIITPDHGQVLRSPITVRFGLKGMGVAPAGTRAPNTGHHHLLIDTASFDPDKPLPKDDQHRHFGGGQTEVEIDLAPGKHTLVLLLGDHNHVPHDPAVMSKQIEITIKQ